MITLSVQIIDTIVNIVLLFSIFIKQNLYI